MSVIYVHLCISDDVNWLQKPMFYTRKVKETLRQC